MFLTSMLLTVFLYMHTVRKRHIYSVFEVFWISKMDHIY